MRLLNLVFVLVAIAFAYPNPASAENEEDLIIPVLRPETQPLPGISYVDSREMPYQLSAVKANLIVLHFWATWCVPCVEEFPELDVIQREYATRGLKVIALSADGIGNVERVRSFLREHKIQSIEPLFDPKNVALFAVSGKGLPTTIFLNRKHEVIARVSGPIDWMAVETRLFIEHALRGESPG